MAREKIIINPSLIQLSTITAMKRRPVHGFAMDSYDRADTLLRRQTCALKSGCPFPGRLRQLDAFNGADLANRSRP
jgi:hypothetical protein